MSLLVGNLELSGVEYLYICSNIDPQYSILSSPQANSR